MMEINQYDNKLNRLICARVYKMSARFGTSMSAWLILMDAETM